MPANSEPIVSIILCTFNGALFLRQQLESLEKQTYHNVEIICSDNNSTDATKQILGQWCLQDERRKLLVCSQKGLNENFFNAIKYANGEYIIFCDQDDIWLHEKVEKLVKFHQTHSDATLVYCLSKVFTQQVPLDWQLKREINRLEGNDLRETLLISHTLGHNICIRKKILEKIPVPENEVVAYDWWITVSAMCLGNIKCLPEILTLWRQHSANTTKELNMGFFYVSRIGYLQQFLHNALISDGTKHWIKEAISKFEKLHRENFSMALFIFILKNAPFIFFYKTKVNPLAKWLSFSKWAFKMSNRKFTVS